MAEFGVERQGVQPVARTQRSRMCIIAHSGANNLLKHATTTGGAGTEKITYPADLADDNVGLRGDGRMASPAAFGQCGQKRWGSGDSWVLIDHN